MGRRSEAMKKRVWVPCLAAVLAAAVVTVLALPREEARAGSSSDELTKLVNYVKGDAAFNLKLQAIQKIVTQKATDGTVEDELETLAKGGDEKLAIYCASALGRRGGSAAKDKLKSLVTDEKAGKNARIAALSAIAFGFKDRDDLSWLAEKTEGDSALSSQYAWLKKNVYGERE
jgi:hypothetical protein